MSSRRKASQEPFRSGTNCSKTRINNSLEHRGASQVNSLKQRRKAHTGLQRSDHDGVKLIILHLSGTLVVEGQDGLHSGGVSREQRAL